jgi:hypothetical protein
MWILLWLVLSAFIVGVFIWSTRILQQQKRTWKAFAAKSGMTYEAGKMMESPKLSGTLGLFQVDIYSATQAAGAAANNFRGQRYVTVIEINLGAGMPVGAGMGTKEFKNLMASHPRFTKTYKPDHADWRDDYVLGTANVKKLKTYLNPARLKLVSSIFEMKNAAVLLIFDEDEGFLHIETSDPLRNLSHISSIMKRLVNACRHIVLSDDEKSYYAKWPKDADGNDIDETAEEAAKDADKSSTTEEKEREPQIEDHGEAPIEAEESPAQEDETKEA